MTVVKEVTASAIFGRRIPQQIFHQSDTNTANYTTRFGLNAALAYKARQLIYQNLHLLLSDVDVDETRRQ